MSTKEKGCFNEFLTKKGLRMTRQREMILDEFLRIEGHLTAEELTLAVKKRDSTIGQATVYRILKILVDSGIAREVRLGSNVVKYEHNIDHEHHDHLICERCGKTIEIVDQRIEELQKGLAEDHKFIITGHIMNIFGICEECRGR
ncbi:MAG: transcriptional repressor [Syntrophorhabdaceae bacterium]|nr:transcriptional repressor [Syntrophorhabdaceae bacterium]